jgi:hypothetical protein
METTPDDANTLNDLATQTNVEARSIHSYIANRAETRGRESDGKNEHFNRLGVFQVFRRARCDATLEETFGR